MLETLKKHGRTVRGLSLLRRYYLDYRLDVALDAKLAPTGVSLHQDREDHGGAIDRDQVRPLIGRSCPLEAPHNDEVGPRGRREPRGPAKTAVSKVIAL